MSEINELKQLAEMQQRINELEQDQMECCSASKHVESGCRCGCWCGSWWPWICAFAAQLMGTVLPLATKRTDSATLLVSNAHSLWGRGESSSYRQRLGGAAKLFDGVVSG